VLRDEPLTTVAAGREVERRTSWMKAGEARSGFWEMNRATTPAMKGDWKEGEEKESEVSFELELELRSERWNERLTASEVPELTT